MRQLTLEGIEECIRLKKKANAIAQAGASTATESEGGGYKDHRLPKNIPREEFFEAVSLGEHDVEIVQAPVPVPAQQETAGVEGEAHDGVSSKGVGDGELGEAVGRKVQGPMRRGVEDGQEQAMDKADRDTVASSDEEDSDSDVSLTNQMLWYFVCTFLIGREPVLVCFERETTAAVHVLPKAVYH